MIICLENLCNNRSAARFIGVNELVRFLAGKFLDSAEALLFYGPTISHAFLEDAPSGLIQAAVSKFEEALKSLVALWEKWRAGPAATNEPGAMKLMTMRKLRVNGKSVAIEIPGRDVLQIIKRWNLPTMLRLERTRQAGGQVLQDLFVDFKKDGSATRGQVVFTVTLGDRNQRGIGECFFIL